jgi:hypothetical protein
MRKTTLKKLTANRNLSERSLQNLHFKMFKCSDTEAKKGKNRTKLAKAISQSQGAQLFFGGM